MWSSAKKNPLRWNPVRQHPPNAAVASLRFHLRGTQQTGVGDSAIPSPRQGFQLSRPPVLLQLINMMATIRCTDHATLAPFGAAANGRIDIDQHWHKKVFLKRNRAMNGGWKDVIMWPRPTACIPVNSRFIVRISTELRRCLMLKACRPAARWANCKIYARPSAHSVPTCYRASLN